MALAAASLTLLTSRICGKAVSGKALKCYHDIVIFDKMGGFAFSQNFGRKLYCLEE